MDKKADRFTEIGHPHAGGENWTEEVTTDLTNWFSLVHSGNIPPLKVSLQLSNTAQAQFYRVVSRQSLSDFESAVSGERVSASAN